MHISCVVDFPFCSDCNSSPPMLPFIVTTSILWMQAACTGLVNYSEWTATVQSLSHRMATFTTIWIFSPLIFLPVTTSTIVFNDFPMEMLHPVFHFVVPVIFGTDT